MILVTAGHIDHGKTALVRALTGVDTDRLPAEKTRGMTLDLGFAHARIGGGTDGPVVGVVDVPGHERLVRTMVAGAAGVDHALLVVAADDGPMPQTEEHVAILDRLGITAATVALTKTDRAGPEAAAAALARLAALLAPTPFADAPVFGVSATTGDGVAALAAHLAAAARRHAARAPTGWFRLAVDRAFVLTGAGVVATGTAFSGRVAVGDRLVVSPDGTEVRVRSIHAGNAASGTGVAGQRLGLAVAGVGRDALHRGQWLVDPALHAPTRRIEGRVHAGAEGLRHWMAVHVHLGAAAVTGRLALLDGRRVAPGEDGLAHILVDAPIGALAGDRFVLRDAAARRTLGGGGVIDPWPEARGRTRPGRAQRLAALEEADPARALAALLPLAPEGVDLDRFARARNLRPDEARAALAAVPMVRAASGRRAVDPARWDAVRRSVLGALDRTHRDAPQMKGLSVEAVRRAAGRPLPPDAFGDLCAELAADGTVVADGPLLRRPGHDAVLAPRDAALWRRLQATLAEAGGRPPPLAILARTLGVEPQGLARLLRRLAGAGQVVALDDRHHVLPATRAALAGHAAAAADADGRLSLAAFRARTGLGRNLAIVVLEHFDRTGLTAREGDDRRLRTRDPGWRP